MKTRISFTPRMDVRASRRRPLARYAGAVLVLAAGLLAGSQAAAAVVNLPLLFEPNVGQAPAEALYVARGDGHQMLLRGNAVALRLKPQGTAAHEVSIEWRGGSRGAILRGEDRATGHSNVLRGSDPSRWMTRVPHYRQVRYEDVYPGIDLVVYGSGRNLEYDFVVKPGADPAVIRLQFHGTEKVELTAAGDLHLQTPLGVLEQKAPVCYQRQGATRTAVAAAYRVTSNREIGFAIGDYDRTSDLVIDPVLLWATYYGGTGMDGANAIAIDGQRNVYVAGQTESLTLAGMGTNEIQAPSRELPGDGFVMKLSPDGSTVLYATYLGGSLGDAVLAMAADSAGNVYVGGRTDSVNFPISQNARQRGNASSGSVSGDGFVAKLDPSGALVYSTYLGGGRRDQVLGITVDAAGNAYVTGETGSDSFPTSAGSFRRLACGGANTDAFVTKVNGDGSNFVYSTYVCGERAERGLAIAVDQDGNAYVGGETYSNDFPVTPGVFRNIRRGDYPDAFVFKLNPAGSQLVYSTYLGGNFADSVQSIAVDQLRFAYVGGSTLSYDFPVTNGAYQQTNRDGGLYEEGFVTKLSPDGTNLAFSTYLGGAFQDRVTGLTLDGSGNVYVTGYTASPNFPQSVSNCQPGKSGKIDAFAGRLAGSGAQLDWMVVMGGKGDDYSYGIARDADNNVYLAGRTESVNLPSTPGAFRTAYGQGYRGGGDAFVAKIAGGSSATTPCIAAGGIVNGASFLAGPVAPGQIISIFGDGIGPATLTTAVLQNGFLTKALGGVQVLFDGVPGAMVFAWNNQLSTIVPYGVAGKRETKVRVEFNGARSPEVSVPVSGSAPGIFSFNSSGEGPGAILNQDGSVNTLANRAAAGSIIVIYATGAGQTTPGGEDGKIAAGVLPLPKPALPVKVFIGGVEAEILYAGDAPFLVSGALQVNARIPPGTPAGALLPVVVQVGEASSQVALSVAVR